jgi:C-terminal peptidase prc
MNKMKNISARNTILLIGFTLLLAALACQTVTGAFSSATATSSLDPIPTKTAVPASPTETPEEEISTTETPQEEISTPEIDSLPTPTTTPISLDMQKQIFQELWMIVRDDYLYDDFNGLDWTAIYQEYTQRIDGGMDTAEFYFAMDEMIYRLGDEHSVFMSPQAVAAEALEYAGDHDYVGIGVWVQYVPERERAVILLTFPGGPAEEAGIKSRDFLISVEGQPLNDDFGAALDLLLGIEGTPVTFTVQTPGEEPRQMTINRERITGTLPVPYEVLTTESGKRIGYILLPTFSDSSIGNQVGSALADMTKDAPLDGIILDNRINGGGYDNVMASTLAYFTDGLVGHFTNRLGQEELRIPRKNVGGSASLPLVVLVGPETVSFGEVFSGILKDQSRATLIGETTDGNVEILWGYNFDDGSRAWIAHDTFKPINNPDSDWEHEGIVVDIEAPAYWDEYTQENDPAILAALEFLEK